MKKFAFYEKIEIPTLQIRHKYEWKNLKFQFLNEKYYFGQTFTLRLICSPSETDGSGGRSKRRLISAFIMVKKLWSKMMLGNCYEKKNNRKAPDATKVFLHNTCWRVHICIIIHVEGYIRICIIIHVEGYTSSYYIMYTYVHISKTMMRRKRLLLNFIMLKLQFRCWNG